MYLRWIKQHTCESKQECLSFFTSSWEVHNVESVLLGQVLQSKPYSQLWTCLHNHATAYDSLGLYIREVIPVQKLSSVWCLRVIQRSQHLTSKEVNHEADAHNERRDIACISNPAISFDQQDIVVWMHQQDTQGSLLHQRLS